MTEGAVSRQIANLEASLGIKLFTRAKKRVTLTRAGKAYSERVSQSLICIERDALEIMARAGEGGILELAVLPTFATQWLIPRIKDFYSRHPEITVNMSARTGLFMFDDTPFDAAIHFGEPRWAGARTDYLFGEETVPVCVPDLAKGRRRISARTLSGHTLLHSMTRPEDWHNWFLAAGIHDVNTMKGPRFELHSMLISATCAGLGVALLPRFLVADQLSSGQLIIPTAEQPRNDNDRAYFLVHPEGREMPGSLMAFKAWLLAAAAVENVA